MSERIHIVISDIDEEMPTVEAFRNYGDAEKFAQELEEESKLISTDIIE